MKTILKSLLMLGAAMALVSCSMKNIESEDGTIVAKIDKQNVWTVIKAESATYSPFMDVGNKHGSFDGNRSQNMMYMELAANWALVSAQDLTLQCGNKIIELNQPVFSDYGKIEVGEKGVVVYVRWDSVQNNVFVSNKKLHPRFLPAKALK